MKANLRFVYLLLKMKLSRMMVYRLSFFGVTFADGSLFVIHLLTFMIIYGNIGSIGGWSRGQMIVFVGTFSIINALNMLIYFFGVNGIPQKIRTGDLDQYITKPVNPLLRLTFESINPGSFPLVILSVMIVAYGASVGGIAVSFSLAARYAALVLLMTLLWYDMEIIIRTIPFFVISVDGITQLEGHMLELNFKVPGVLFRGAFRIFFYYVAPYGIMATVPTQYLTGAASAQTLAHAVCVVAAFTAFTLWFWKFGLRHYKSASS